MTEGRIMEQAGADGRAKRESVFRTASIFFPGTSRTLDCRVRNVSPTGVGVSHRGELRAGMSIRIAVGKAFPLDARVVWANASQAGIAYATEPVTDEPQFEGYAPSGPAGWLAEMNDPYLK